MLQNPGKNITIYNMAALIKDAWMKAATPQNIASGFQVSGIWPVNEFVYEDTEYLPAAVTDHPLHEPPVTDQPLRELPVTDQPLLEQNNALVEESTLGTSVDGPSEERQSTPGAEQGGGASSASTSTETPRAECSGTSFISPAHFRGYPKAPERKESRQGRSMIATSTPEISRIGLELIQKRAKRSKVVVKPNAKRKIFETFPDSDSDLDMEISDVIDNHSDSGNDDTDSDFDVVDHETLVLGSVDYPKIGDFVLVEYQMKTKVVYYIGTVKKERDTDDELEIEFLKRMKKEENKFVASTVQDIASVHIDQLKAVLPPPVCSGTTSRTKGIMVFNQNFGNIDLR